ncbi:hypothetical protein PaG_01095 [Moesziomyces aphidis]|uniref:Uncharacterized protein n=1 Tax=Moesziomyces aphidis TaxID=84754 RepID=W3VSZ3_MOEAP|nr:hypothetical protein PaG_01095 [Moesziomyces aphidis]
MSMLGSTVGLGHSVVGIMSLLAPESTGKLLCVPSPRAANFVSRLFGVRELLLGASLLLSIRNNRSLAERMQLLTIINIMNATDTISGIVEYFNRTIDLNGFVLGSGGAFTLFCLGMIQASNW